MSLLDVAFTNKDEIVEDTNPAMRVARYWCTILLLLAQLKVQIFLLNIASQSTFNSASTQVRGSRTVVM